VRRLDPEEIEQRRAAGRARAERMAQARKRKPSSPELQQAIERAEAALLLVISDVESTTPVRERSRVLRYDDWIYEDAQDPGSWLLDGGGAEGDEDYDEDDELAVACRFGGLTFALDGAQSIADIAADIAFQVQDDVTDEIWGAWPVCLIHQHPMSPTVAEETAIWRCPAEAEIAVPIGQLGGGAVSQPSSPSSSPPG
jgi:hypothetical protein